MQHPRDRNKKRRSGFTLLEVLLVVGILALLAAVVAPRLIGTQQQAQVDVTRTEIATFEGVLNLYFQQNGSYPTTEQGLQALLVRPEEPPLPRAWSGPYLEDDDLTDAWQSPYQYAYPGERNVDTPDIWSLGPDGEDGTDDDIGNWKSDVEDDLGEGRGGARTDSRSDRGSERGGRAGSITGRTGGSARTD